MSVEVLKQIWPEWQIEGKPLGKGSFGVVYKAVRRDHGVESYAAIKVISIPTDPSEVDSLRSEGLDMNATRTYLQGIVNDFVSEIQLMESLKGVQNIVSVEDYKVVEKTGEIGWDIYIRMELLTSFNAYICDKKLTEEEVIKLGCDICTALEICAKRNIIHRDIKPENIFINDFGYFKLGDFGIARKMENMTSGLSQKGTFNYMAPEVANSSEYDARVDTYSLGIVLYRLLNGNRLPFLDTEKQLLNPNERRNAVDRRLRGEDLPAPCDASPAMADLILRSCAYDPNMRFSSATEMKQALMSVANGTYQMGASNLYRTTSVRRAPANYDKTTSVRKAPAASNQKSAPAVNTFGSAPKKKSKMPAVIAAVLAVVLLVGAGIFAVPKLLDGGDSTNYSKFDEEQIASIISEAEALAAEEDYEGALVKVQTGLVTYPKSAELQDKADEYTEALNAQVKAKTLDEAKTLADSGNYVSAIALIKNAQETQGDDTEYQSALKTYSNAYKSEIITSTDALAAEGDYVGAMAKIGEAKMVVGNDAELDKKAQEYEDNYITGIINESNDLVSVNKYTEATALINATLTEFPNNQKLLEQRTAIQTSMPQNFMDVCTPYEMNKRTSLHAGTSSFNMSGEQYRSGITMHVMEDGSWFLSNLKGQYSELQFDLGHVDDSGMTNVMVDVYLDNVLYDSYVVSSSGLPTRITIPVTDVRQIKVYATGDWDNYGGYPTIGLGNMTIKGNPNGTKNQETAIDPSAKNFMDMCTPYEMNKRTSLHTGTSSFNMSGEQYRSGITMHVMEDGSWFLSNLKGQYSELQFDLGHVDDSGMTNVMVDVYLDNVLYDSYVVSSSGLPTRITIPVTDVRQIKVYATGDWDNYGGYPTIGLGDMTIK